MFSRINEALVSIVARLQREAGQALAEYGLILALIAIACIVALGLLAVAISGSLGDVAAKL